jgi:predicted kinase
MTQLTYARLTAFAKTILEAGDSVVADATYLKAAQRKMLYDMANALGQRVEVIDFDLPHESLRQRILDRRHDLSEASTEVLERQILSEEPLTPDEQQAVVETLRD